MDENSRLLDWYNTLLMHKKKEKKNKTNYFTLLINLLEIWHMVG